MDILSPQQQAAVDFTGKRLMVIAGPGSGKTKTMTRAIEAAIDRGVDPKRVLAVTFTRLAAGQMKDRLAASGIEGPTVGTFHSICYTIVQRHWRELGYSSGAIQVLDRVEQKNMIKETIMRSRHNPPITSVERILSAMGQDVEMPKDTDPDTRSIVESYLRQLLEANAIDYPMVPYLALRAAEKHPPGWTHVFVDECQDLDFAQWRLFHCINPNFLFAVGDPDQLLYSWRGADVGLMRRQAKEWSAEIVKLEDNYRCPSRIVDHANRIIAVNKNRIEKSMVAIRTDPGEIRTIGEADVVGAVRAMDGSVAVLGRTHQSLRGVSMAMVQAGMNPLLAGERERLLERDDIRHVLALISFRDLPFSTRVAERVWRLHGWQSLTIERTRAECRRIGRSLYEATVDKIDSFAHLYDECDFLMERLQLAIMYVNRFTGSISREDASSLGKVVAHFIRNHALADRTGDRLIAWIGMRDGQDEVNLEGDLHVMTIHAAKGLEFDHVVLVGLDDWTLPIKKAHKKPDMMEEERRLMFVAMTRARQTLTLVVPEEGASRFLMEAGLCQSCELAE